MRSGKIFIRATLCLAGIFLLLVGIFANDQPSKSNIKNDLILIKLSTPDGTQVEFAGYDRETMSFSKGDTRFVLIPSLLSERDLLIKVSIINGGTIEKSRTLKMPVGATAKAFSSLAFNIEVEGIKKNTEIEKMKYQPCQYQLNFIENAKLKTKNYLNLENLNGYRPVSYTRVSIDKGSGGCCVTCEEGTLCGCRVRLSCGTCCSGPCCQPTQE